MVTLLYRFAQKKNQRLTVEASLDDFVDADAVPAYAQEAARWAVEQGILKGDENQNLNLLTSLTRAQIAVLRILDDKKPMLIDDLAARTDIPMRQILSAVTMLEIDGLIRQEGMRMFLRTVEVSETKE